MRPKRQKTVATTTTGGGILSGIGLDRAQRQMEEDEEEAAAAADLAALIEPSLIFECELCIYISSTEKELWAHR